jgi:hypothetical protein
MFRKLLNITIVKEIDVAVPIYILKCGETVSAIMMHSLEA